jgi:hypothetical protein
MRSLIFKFIELFNGSKRNQGYRLIYNKDEQMWAVRNDNGILYYGSKSQCESFMSNIKGQMQVS